MTLVQKWGVGNGCELLAERNVHLVKINFLDILNVNFTTTM